MRFTVYSVVIMLVASLFVTACGEKKKENLPAQQVVFTKIHEVEEEMEEEPPPPPAFNLTSFNIFVLNNQSVYYYYDPSFLPKKEFDEYRFENLKEALIHKSSYKDLKTILGKLVKDHAFAQKRIRLAIKDNDRKIERRIVREILNPLGIEQAGVGYISEELESLLTKKQ